MGPGGMPYLPKGWSFVSLPRVKADPRGRFAGGVAMLLPPGVTAVKLTVPTYDGGELEDLLFCSLTSRGAQFVVGLMYLVPCIGVTAKGWTDHIWKQHVRCYVHSRTVS